MTNDALKEAFICKIALEYPEKLAFTDEEANKLQKKVSPKKPKAIIKAKLRSLKEIRTEGRTIGRGESAFAGLKRSYRASKQQGKRQLGLKGRYSVDEESLANSLKNSHGAVVSFASKKPSAAGRAIMSLSGSRWSHTGILDVDEKGRPWVIHNFEGNGGVKREPLGRYVNNTEFKFQIPKGMTTEQRQKAVQIARQAATEDHPYPLMTLAAAPFYDLSQRISKEKAPRIQAAMRRIAEGLAVDQKEFEGVCSTLPQDVYARALGKTTDQEKSELASYFLGKKVDPVKYKWISPGELQESPNMQLTGHYKPRFLGPKVPKLKLQKQVKLTVKEVPELKRA
jgi:hypothetical protein